MAEEKKREPQGIVAIVTNGTGDVIATASDFDRQTPGGFKLWEGQRHRARQSVMWNTVKAYSSTALSDAVDYYLAEQLFNAMQRKSNHRITYRAVGYSDDIAAEVGRH